MESDTLVKRAPGPAPTSCITCRRQKKKCDRNRPSCTRCKEGGRACLGYAQGSRLDVSYSVEAGSAGTASIPTWIVQIDMASNAAKTATLLTQQIQGDPLFLGASTGNLGPVELSASGTLFTQCAFDEPQFCHLDTLSPYSSATIPANLEYFNSHDEERESSELTSDSQDWTVTQRTQSCGSASSADVGYTLPPRFIPNSEISGVTVRFIISQYEPLYELERFRPIKIHASVVRKRFVARLMSSSIARWSRYVGAQVLHDLQRDKERANFEQYHPWLDRLGQLCITSGNDASLDDMIGRLSAALELTFLKFIALNAKFGYALLRGIAPLFMQVAFSDPTLWPHDPSSSGVSLAHALSCFSWEVGRFVLVDTVSSLTFGTPPLVEYDTSHPFVQAKNGFPIGWVHSCPAQFVLSIMKINQWRARHPSKCFEEHVPWKEIEDDTLAWRPICEDDPDSHSNGRVVRFAVQEGWRHALLIYLYMGMCDVTSHDPRVQSSVRQISRLHISIQSQLTARTQFMIPLLLAAICTRSETNRSRFSHALSNSGRNGMWLLSGVEFASILDHLWHGAAVNGEPVTWNDYVSSRRAVIDM